MRFARSIPIIISSIDRPPLRAVITRPDHAIHATHRKGVGRQPPHLFSMPSRLGRSPHGPNPQSAPFSPCALRLDRLNAPRVAPIAQLVEQLLRKQWVGGSSPSWGTIQHAIAKSSCREASWRTKVDLERVAFNQIHVCTSQPEAAIAHANAFGLRGEFNLSGSSAKQIEDDSISVLRDNGRKFALIKAWVRVAQAAMASRDTSVAEPCKALATRPADLCRYAIRKKTCAKPECRPPQNLRVPLRTHRPPAPSSYSQCERSSRDHGGASTLRGFGPQYHLGPPDKILKQSRIAAISAAWQKLIQKKPKRQPICPTRHLWGSGRCCFTTRLSPAKRFRSRILRCKWG